VIKFEGDHNSTRPSFFMDSVTIFFQNTLQVDAILTDQNTMSQEERKEFVKRMEERRAEQRKVVEEISKSKSDKKD
jgi:hypothetical protein